MEILVYAIVFSLILIVSNATNKLIPTLPLPLIQILLGDWDWLSLTQFGVPLRYRALFGLGYWTIALSRSRRSRYYFRLKALAGYPLFDFPCDFYLNH